MDSKLLNTKPPYPIRTAARMLNISVHTLRMYEREGLIIPQKSEGNQRIYSKDDIERISCIRNAINDLKISINGIKTIYSLIPCWEIIKCSTRDRSNCEAYNGSHMPCWTYKHPGTKCESLVCRECDVYNNHTHCGAIKELIKSISPISKTKQ